MASRELEMLNGQAKSPTVPGAVSDFIPISCHYDSNILITKSGDLLVSIAVDGYNLDRSNTVSMRSRVRDALLNHIDTYKIAAHLHVIREWRNIVPKGIIPFGFPAAINNAWCKYNNWDKQLVNTLYITLIYQGTKVAPLDPRCAIPSVIANKFEDHWNEASAKLHQVADVVCNELKSIGARKLAIVEGKTGSVSEPLSLHYYLTHFKEEQSFAPLNDLADYLANINIDYQFNHMHITDGASKTYAAVYTMKESPDVPDRVYNALLQSPMKFVISEVLLFVDKVLALKAFADYFEILQMGRDSGLAEFIGLKGVLDSDKGRVADFCSYQVNIIIHSEDKEIFQKNINKACGIFRETGLLAVREDFNMARCFWATLPGNFRFLCRTKYGAANHLMNLSAIHDENLGNQAGSGWGPPITLFRTEYGTPFYFNFHVEESGHTLIVGPRGVGKTTLCKFLLAQSVRVDPHIIYIDMNGENEKFINKMSGKYISITENDSPIKVFPFDDKLFYEQKEAMNEWLYEAFLLGTESKKKDAKTFIDTLMDNLMSLPSIAERQKAFIAILEDIAGQGSVHSFAGLMQKDIYEKLFNEDSLGVITSENVIGINLSGISNPLLRTSFLKILLLKIEQVLGNAPVVIALNKSVSLFEGGSFTKLLQPWLQRLAQKDGIAILELENSKKIQANHELQAMLSSFSSRLFVTDNLADKSFKFAYNLTDDELRKIKTYTPERRMFLIKQEQMSIVASFYMDGMQQLMEGD